MNDKAIQAKIEAIIADAELDLLVLGDLYNIQYATGVQLPAAQAQSDLIILAAFRGGQAPALFVPHCWLGTVRTMCPQSDVISYRPAQSPLLAAVAALQAWAGPAQRLGLDEATLPVLLSRQLSEMAAAGGLTLVDCSEAIADARLVKTPTEQRLLSEIAYKIDHVINGHLHHLSADRRRTASLMSESVRIHALERDIPIQGYNACARAIRGTSLAHFWAHAPKFGFADVEMTQDRDAIIIDIANCEAGYWSNAARIAISHDEMSPAQAAAYGALVALRDMLLAALRTGRSGADVYREVTQAGQAAELPLVTELPLGFGVGVAPLEGPFLAPGEERALATGMVLVLDPVVRHDGLYYRSRDTVVLRESGPEIVNWYKDWREPYLAILEL